MTDTYTDEELQTLPQTETVFEAPQLDFDKHVWIQQGYTAIDQCCDHPPVTLPNATLLINENGRYRLVDELTRA